MITEEQIKSVLNSLRLNIYDKPEYEIDTWIDSDTKGGCRISINNKETKNVLEIYFYTHKSKWIFGKHFYVKYKKPIVNFGRYIVNGSGTIDKLEISEKLYDEFYTYIKERYLEDQFIAESNVNSEFGL